MNIYVPIVPKIEPDAPMTEKTDIITLADQYMVAAANGRDLPDFCAERGIDLVAIAAPFQIDPDVFGDFKARISFDKFCRLLEALAAVSGDDTFGLKYGQYFKDGGTGPYGFGLSQAPTFRDALSFIAKYTRILVDLEVFNVTIEDTRITIEWTYSPLITQHEQFADFAATRILDHMRECAGQPFQLLKSQLERRAPRNKSLHLQTYSKNITFGADMNAVILPGDLVQRINPTADRVMFEYMSSQCDEIVKSISRKKDIITLLKEDFIEHMAINDRAIETIARRLGMSERTLQRRLTGSGTTFWDVYENTRDELSTRLLANTDRSLSEITQQLGYSTQSAYSRFVKRMHGKSPGQLRTQYQSKKPQ